MDKDYITIGHILKACSQLPTEQTIPISFIHPNSYRGDYYACALQVSLEKTTVGDTQKFFKNVLDSDFYTWDGYETLAFYKESNIYLVENLDRSDHEETLGELIKDFGLPEEATFLDFILHIFGLAYSDIIESDVKVVHKGDFFHVDGFILDDRLIYKNPHKATEFISSIYFATKKNN